MTIQQFFDAYEGIWIESSSIADTATRDQCVDLFRIYNSKVIGGNDVGGNAVDYWTNYPLNFYDKIPNTPTGVPQLGDVIIWGTKYGAYGHIAVCTDIADTKGFTSFDQNDPLKSKCHYQPHTYTGVLGWLHPKKLPVDIPELGWLKQMYQVKGIDLSQPEGSVRGKVQEIFDGSEKYQEAVKARDKALADLAEARGDATKWEENYMAANMQIAEFKKEIESLNTKVTTRDSEITSLQTRVTSLESQLDPNKVIVVTRDEYARLTALKKLDKFTSGELIQEILNRLFNKGGDK
jgi:hypothetical protein